MCERKEFSFVLILKDIVRKFYNKMLTGYYFTPCTLVQKVKGLIKELFVYSAPYS